jgi:hypothetical protein
MTGTTHNTCALARARFTHDRSVCPVVTLYGVDAEDPDAQWPPWCALVDNRGVCDWLSPRSPGLDARRQEVTENLRRLEEFCNSNRCRVSP